VDNSTFFHEICPVPFTSSLKLLFSPRPGLGTPVCSYLEVALYKFHRYIDKDEEDQEIYVTCYIAAYSRIRILIMINDNNNDNSSNNNNKMIFIAL